MILQADGKKRVIDNARKSLHNTHTELFETIHTVSVDFVAAVASMISHRSADEDEFPEWIQLRLGTDDLPDAYRGVPVNDAHQRFSVVAGICSPTWVEIYYTFWSGIWVGICSGIL